MNKVSSFPVLGRKGTSLVQLLCPTPPVIQSWVDMGTLMMRPQHSAALSSCHLSVVGSVRVAGGGGSVAAIIHSPGMPGGLPVSVESLEHHAPLLSQVGADDALLESAGSEKAAHALPISQVLLAASRSLRQSDESSEKSKHPRFSTCFLHNLARRLSDWDIVQQGVASLERRGTQLMRNARLRLTFPYHVPAGPAGVTSREFFDVSREATGAFGTGFVHGQKRLSRWGTATCVGVRSAAEGEIPSLYWHVSGRTAATLAPELLILPSVEVGDVMLSFGGPTATDMQLLTPDNPSKYCHTPSKNELDTTEWLSFGLFRHKIGSTVGPGIVAAGVMLDESDGELRLELACRDREGHLTRLTDYKIYGDSAFSHLPWIPF